MLKDTAEDGGVLCGGLGFLDFLVVRYCNIYIILRWTMNFGGGLQDQMLKTYIDQIFDKYDTDRSGTLDEQEMTHFFNDLFNSLGMNITVTE